MNFSFGFIEKAATEMSNRILYEECLEHYNESMIKATEGDLYYDHYRLLEIHESTKEEAMKQVNTLRKFHRNFYTLRFLNDTN